MSDKKKPLEFRDGLAYSDVAEWVVREAITCKDGFRVSVQASRSHYCVPRQDQGPWSKVEVGYPSAKPTPWKEWKKYCEDPTTPTGTVYAGVPVYLVEQLIARHNKTSRKAAR